VKKNLEDIIEFNNRHPKKSQYSLIWLAIIYGLGLMVCWMLALISPLFLPIGYLVVGIILSIFISRHFHWWMMTNNVQTIFAAKMKFIPRWIFATPRLLFKVFIVKVV